MEKRQTAPGPAPFRRSQRTATNPGSTVAPLHQRWENVTRVILRPRRRVSTISPPSFFFLAPCSCWDTDSMDVQWQITPRTCSMCVTPSLIRPRCLIPQTSGRSAVSPDEKSIVVSNLFDGLDWYTLSDQKLSHTVPYPINLQHNVPVPVQFTDDGTAIIVGGTCGSGRVLDASTFETIQMLPHDGTSSLRD